MWIYTAAPVIGLLSLAATVILLVAAVFPGSRLKRLKLAGAAFILFAMCLAVGDPPAELTAAQEAADAKAQHESAKQREAEMLSTLRGHIAFLQEFDARKMTEDVSTILLAVEMLSLPATDLHEAAGLELSPETIATEKELRQLLRETQKGALPILRDAYGPALRKALWEDNGSAKTFGEGYRTIDIVLPAFASNRNIKSFHEDADTVLIKLRFGRVNYKWVKDPLEFTYFRLNAPKDADLVIWDDAGRFTELLPIR